MSPIGQLQSLKTLSLQDLNNLLDRPDEIGELIGFEESSLAKSSICLITLHVTLNLELIFKQAT